MIRPNQGGGSKPKMFSGSRDIFIENASGGHESGFYEISNNSRVVARRVELKDRGVEVMKQVPKGSTLLKALSEKQISLPPHDARDSGGGHIHWYPTELGWDFPAVGVDVNIWKRDLWDVGRNLAKVGAIEFCVQLPLIQGGAKIVERWHIEAIFFARVMKIYPPESQGQIASWTPQFQVPVTVLTFGPSSLR